MEATEGHIKALRQIQRSEAGEQVVLNQQDAEECCNEGWAVSNSGVVSGYSLTQEGRALIGSD